MQMRQHLQKNRDAIYHCVVNGTKELLRCRDTEKLRETSFALVMLRGSFTFILKGKLYGGS